MPCSITYKLVTDKMDYEVPLNVYGGLIAALAVANWQGEFLGGQIQSVLDSDRFQDLFDIDAKLTAEEAAEFARRLRVLLDEQPTNARYWYSNGAWHFRSKLDTNIITVEEKWLRQFVELLETGSVSIKMVIHDEEDK